MESFGRGPLIETDFQRVAAPVAEPQAPAAEPRPAEPRAGASNANANPNLWKTPEPAPDPFAEASNEVRRKTASGSAKPGAVIDMNAEDDGGVDRVVSAPRRPTPMPDVAEIGTLDGGAGDGDGSEMFAAKHEVLRSREAAEKPEPKPRDPIAEAFEASARD